MDRLARFIPHLLIFAFAVSLLLALFILSPWWFLSPWSGLPDEVQDRINLAQLVVETAGFSLALAAGIFAASEFRQSRLGPSLYLSLYDPETGDTRDSLVTAKDGNKSVPFHIRIHNTGPVVARFVKVHIAFIGRPLFIRDHPLWAFWRSPESLPCPLKKYWHCQDREMGREFIFDGKDEWVLHPETRDLLGSFALSVVVASEYPPSPYQVSYQIFADRMSPRKGSFAFHVTEPAE